MTPDEPGLEGGKTLQDALGDESDLNVPMIGGELAADPVAIFFGLAVEELIAVPALDRPHGPHPEVNGAQLARLLVGPPTESFWRKVS